MMNSELCAFTCKLTRVENRKHALSLLLLLLLSLMIHWVALICKDSNDQNIGKMLICNSCVKCNRICESSLLSSA